MHGTLEQYWCNTGAQNIKNNTGATLVHGTLQQHSCNTGVRNSSTILMQQGFNTGAQNTSTLVHRTLGQHWCNTRTRNTWTTLLHRTLLTTLVQHSTDAILLYRTVVQYCFQKHWTSTPTLVKHSWAWNTDRPLEWTANWCTDHCSAQNAGIEQTLVHGTLVHTTLEGKTQ